MMLSCSFVEENQQNVGCMSSSRDLNATKHPFLFFENSLMDFFCPFSVRHGLLTKDTILIFEDRGFESNC